MISEPAQSFSGVTPLDAQLVRMWLHGRAANTVAAYGRDIEDFLAGVHKPIAEVGLQDLQAYEHRLLDRSTATRRRKLAAVKSLLSFATRAGVLASNPGVMLRVAKSPDTRGERIMLEAAVLKMIGAEADPRRRGVLRLLYVCGLRASEVGPINRGDLKGNERKGGGLPVVGKGSKRRIVDVPPALWRELAAVNADASPHAPLLLGPRGGRLNRSAVHRIVKRAARRAGVGDAVSSHWLRHSHASHALANGADLAKVRDSLGHSSIATTSTYLHSAGDGASSYIKG